jgi:3-oxoadipate enol-lactonase
MDLRAEASRISRPLLILSGRDDRTTPPEIGREIAARVRTSEHLELEGGHLPNVDHPVTFRRAVLDFL